MKRTLISAALGVLCGFAVVGHSQAANWSDTSISYRTGTMFSEPGNPNDVRKGIVGLTHVSGHNYGQNFFNVDILKSNIEDPAKGNQQGAQEVYVVYAHQLSLGKVSGSNLSAGPLKDVALTTGIDYSAKNTAFAPQVTKYLVGPTFKFGVAGGFLDLGLLSYSESNNNAITNKEVHFDQTYRVAAAWGIPVASTVSFEGFLNYTGPKGKDGFGYDTQAETWTDLFVMADIGQMVASKPKTVRLGVGYEYVKNKFGGNATDTGTTTTTSMVKLQWHF